MLAFVLNSVTRASTSSAKGRACSKPLGNASFATSSWLGGSVGSGRPSSLEQRRLRPRVLPVAPTTGSRARSLVCVQASEVTMRARSIRDLQDGEIRGKRVFVRSDLNVPLDGKRITDDTRVRASVPTIKYLMEKGAKVIVASHLGRPKGGFEDKYSLAPVASRLSELLGKPVRMAKDCIGDAVASEVAAMSPGDVLLLENVRFYPEEEKNDPEFARKLAANADLYVNDAFGTAHRAHASTAGVTEFLKPAVAGFLLEKELDYLSNAIENPKRPFAAIVGGSKVSSKIGVLEKLLQKCDTIVIGGGMVFTFLRARGLKTGSSLVEEDKIELARNIEEQARKRGIELLLPVDCGDRRQIR
ncbi:hypothetical protein F1559_000106 [Cyanidiococcus yangmingshanensis]|uniref:Phosphoglycerate kinase n=1 Tax=Cyanidiococcus yangmingshanensis TaxID=2690220 RepID=A0A7J7IMI8_9RHOD|nr:hypothetical protein F1559_000106 [Cyanidiococcus yangmingshanensis]